MKNLSVILLALVLAAPLSADEIQTPSNPAALTTNISNEVQNLELSDLGAFLDKKVQEVTDLLNAKIAAELPALATQEKAANVKF